MREGSVRKFTTTTTTPSLTFPLQTQFSIMKTSILHPEGERGEEERERRGEGERGKGEGREKGYKGAGERGKAPQGKLKQEKNFTTVFSVHNATFCLNYESVLCTLYIYDQCSCIPSGFGNDKMIIFQDFSVLKPSYQFPDFILSICCSKGN